MASAARSGTEPRETGSWYAWLVRRFIWVFTTSLCMGVACERPSTEVTDSKEPDLCAKTIDHMMSVASGVSDTADGGRMSLAERAFDGMVARASLATCRREGLSQQQADCILAASNFEQFMAIGACPALREKKPSWLRLPPTPEAIAQLTERRPEGPRAGPVRYQQLAGTGASTCGLRDDGALQCWGSEATVPSGRFTKIGWGWHLCALDHSGRLVCTSDTQGDDLAYLPKDPLVDFAEGALHGCGVKASDGTLVCWNDPDQVPITPPPGEFVSVVSGLRYSCALASNGAATCFGTSAPTPPDKSFVALSSRFRTVCGLGDDGTVTCWGADDAGQAQPPKGRFKSVSCGNHHCCALRDDDAAVCWGSRDDGRSSPPDGEFSVVFAGVAHSCGVRSDGTLCWGLNHMGQGSVPQTPTEHNWDFESL